MAAKALTDLAIKALKPREKPYKVVDGKVPGLLLSVSRTGTKAFLLSFKYGGKFQLLTIGRYPDLSLTDARIAALEAKKAIASGINPAAEKQKEKAQAKAKGVTFHDAAILWFEQSKSLWSDVHAKDTHQKLTCYVYPRIGKEPISAVTKSDVKAILDTLSAQGKYPTLKKVRSIISQIFQYAIAHEFPGVEYDWTPLLRSKGLYQPTKVVHRAALTNPKDISRLMKAISSYKETSFQTCIALKFSALTFCRPGEIRHAEWDELDFDEALWRIPAAKMKMGEPHLVPLAKQAIELLHELHPMTGHSKYLFPSVRTSDRPMSEATITAALRRMGYKKEEMCAHGFRGMASTRLNEMGFNRDWIERQLAHGEKDKIRAAYNHTDFLADRRKMMQAWADYLFGPDGGLSHEHLD